jgi:hypothetical protein
MQSTNRHSHGRARGAAKLFVALALCLCCAALAAQQAAPKKVSVSLTASDKAKFQHFMSDKKITDKITYKSPDLDSSPVLETVLIYKALTLGGLNPALDIVEIPNNERERMMVNNGDIVIAGVTQWDFYMEENKDTLYKSDTVIPNGAFEKGLYTTKEKASSVSVKSAKDLAQLSCVSTSNWRVDWKTLSGLGFKTLTDSPTRTAMFKLVDAGRVDVSLQSFSANPDMSITDSGVTLYPVPGVKILLNGSRHFAVSKKNPDGKAVFEALQKGLAIMKQDNEVSRALTESGFYNKNVKDWKTIQVQQ